MEVSYLKAHPLEGRYPEWTPNFHSDRSQYSNQCARESQGERKRFHFTKAAHLSDIKHPQRNPLCLFVEHIFLHCVLIAAAFRKRRPHF